MARRRFRSKTEQQLFRLCCLALLCAMQIVFARFLVIPVGDSMRFSLSFIPVVFAARYFGILGSVAVYGLGDFLGAIIFPTGGAFQIGFTVTAAVSGLIYGIFLGKECEKPLRKLFSFDNKDIIRIFLSVFTSQLVCSLFLNSFWLSFYYGAPFWAKFVMRIPQAGIMSVLQIAFMVLFLDRICTALRKAGV